MENIRKFETEADVMMLIQPNVVLIADTGKVLYNVEPPKGVFIQHIDGSIHTTDSWTTKGFLNSDANGVAVFTDDCRFVIAKQELGKLAWSSDTTNAVEGVMLTDSVLTARTDYSGAENTLQIASISTSGAAYSCANFTFPNGNKGYLPALGELYIVYNNITNISSAMNLIGGVSFRDTEYWASTQVENSKAYAHKLTSYGVSNSPKQSKMYVRAFTSI